jgi:hypothetical protein
MVCHKYPNYLGHGGRGARGSLSHRSAVDSNSAPGASDSERRHGPAVRPVTVTVSDRASLNGGPPAAFTACDGSVLVGRWLLILATT